MRAWESRRRPQQQYKDVGEQTARGGGSCGRGDGGASQAWVSYEQQRRRYRWENKGGGLGRVTEGKRVSVWSWSSVFFILASYMLSI
jgi:hypothetical protein